MSETGNAINLEHFRRVVEFVGSWGGDYNPGLPLITLPELEAKRDASEIAIDTLTSASTHTKEAINAREIAFEPLPKYATRVIAYYQAVGASESSLADARTIKRKLDGDRKEKLVDDPSTPEDERANAISVSQRSFTQMVEHWDALIELVSGDKLYNPNEAELKITALTAHSTDLKSKNHAVMMMDVAESNARGDRDNEMYAPETGLVDVALAVKKYVKAAFGADSLQYKQIKGLEFRRPTESVAVAA